MTAEAFAVEQVSLPVAVEMEPGVFEIRGNGRHDAPARIERPAMPSWWTMDGGTEESWHASPGGQPQPQPAVTHLINTGAVDCTVTVCPAEDIPYCPCMIHNNPGRQGAHAARTMIGQYTVFADPTHSRRTQLKIEPLPPGVPMILYIEGFQSGTAPEPPPEPERVIVTSNPYGFDAEPFSLSTDRPRQATGAPREAPRPVAAWSPPEPPGRDPITGVPLPGSDSAERVEAEYDLLRRMHAANPKPPRLFPGFVVSCERCNGEQIATDDHPRGGHTMECERCGTMCKVNPEGMTFGAMFPGFAVECAGCADAETTLDNRGDGRVYLECEGCGAMRRVVL